MTEADFAKQVLTYFSDEKYDVYQEVQCRGIIDIVVVQEPIIIAVECKLSLNFDVIEQAFKNTNYANYSYVAVPKRRFGFSEIVCQQFGIGVLCPDHNGDLKEAVKPRFNRRIIKPTLHDYMKRSVAGSQTDRMTSFKYFVEDLERFVSRNPGATFKEAFEGAYRHYSSLSTLKNCLYQYTRNGIINSIEIKDGKLYPKKNDQGKQN